MRKSLLNLILLLVLGIVWICLLWFVFPGTWIHQPLSHLILLHGIPPIAVWLCIVLTIRYYKRRQVAAAKARLEQATAQSVATKEAARSQHEAQMRERRFSCDCRGIWVGGSNDKAIGIAFPGSRIVTPPVQEGDAAGVPVFVQVLSALYKECPGALNFPLYLVPPHDTELMELMRQIKGGLFPVIEATGWEKRQNLRMQCLPYTATPPENVLQIFETNPDLPGAVVMAFNYPAQGMSQAAIDTGSMNAIALLFTNTQLHALLQRVADILPRPDSETGDPYDVFTPFWDKKEIPSGNVTLLIPLNQQERKLLQKLPVLAQIHRGDSLTMNSSWRPLQRQQYLQITLERSLINAGLLDVPFLYAETDEQEATPENANQVDDKLPQEISPQSLRHLIYHADSPQHSTELLSDVGGVFSHVKLDLNPVSEATNIAKVLGNWGVATPWAMIAGSVAQTAKCKGAVLSVYCSGRHDMALGVVVPPN